MLLDYKVEQNAIKAFKRRQNIKAQRRLEHIRATRKIKMLTIVLYGLVWVFALLLMNLLGFNYSVL